MADMAISVEGLSFAYRGADETTEALRDVSLSVRAGERLGVLGPNGGGKSTLLKLMLGLLTPDAGTVGVVGTSARDARASGLVGYVPQRSGAELRFPLSVRQAVELAASVGVPPWRGIGRGGRAGVGRLLDLVGAHELADRAVGQLSGGQLQRVMIARALARRPRVLLLDEPTVGVDVEGQRRFAAMIETVRRELGPAIVTVSHDLRTILATSDRVACLRRELHYHDAPSGLTTKVLAELFSHDVEAMLGGNAAAVLAESIGGERSA